MRGELISGNACNRNNLFVSRHMGLEPEEPYNWRGLEAAVYGISLNIPEIEVIGL